MAKDCDESRRTPTVFEPDVMDAPTIQPKFLSKHDELGLIAVGFSGGQVGHIVLKVCHGAR